MRVLRYLPSPLGPSCSGDTPPSCPSRALCPCPCPCPCAVKPKEVAQSSLWAPQWRRTFLLASAPGVRSLFYYLCFCVRSAPLLVACGLSSGGQMLPHSISSSPRILISSHSIFFPVSLPFPPLRFLSFPFLSFHSIPFHPPPPPICHVYVLHLVSDLNYLHGGRNDRRHSLFILAAFLCSSFMFLLLSRFCAVCTVAVLTCKSLFSRAYASDVIDGRVNVKRAQ